MFDWDDLRIFLTAARASSFGQAAKRLGIDTATVGRRVARLETALKSTLFIRSPAGLQLTAAGARLFDIAAEADAQIAAVAQINRADLVSGVVRISTAEGFGSAVLAPALPQLLRLRPGLRIELAAHAGFLSPSRREVDMAITLSPPTDARVVVEPLTPYQLALYAAPEYLKDVGSPASSKDLRRFQLVGYVPDLIYAPELRYLDEISPSLVTTIASSSIQAQRAVILGGGGIGVLPCFLSHGLVRVLDKEVLIERRFWLSTHKDVHDTARLRAVRAWLKELVQARGGEIRPY